MIAVRIPAHATRLRGDDGVAYGHAWNDADGVHVVDDRHGIVSVHPGEHGFIVARMVCMRRHLALSAAAAVIDAEACVLRTEAYELLREVDVMTTMRNRHPSIAARLRVIEARIDVIARRLPVLAVELQAAERTAARA